MKKNLEPKKKATSTLSKPQGSDYWIKRSIKDKDRDWKQTGNNWIEDYVLSADHPHRQMMIDALKNLEPFAGVLEFGCSAGPNLMRVRSAYPETQLAGFDLNEESIEVAKELLPNAILKTGNMLKTPFEDKSFDIGILDASLMYLSPKEINQGLGEAERVIRKALLILERVTKKEASGYIYSRNYPELLVDRGYKVTTIQLNEQLWPHSKGWQKDGQFIVALLP